MDSNQHPFDSDAYRLDPHAATRIEAERRGLFGFFIVRSRLVLLLLSAITFGGLIALYNIPREADPEVKIPIALVTTVYPGASPADVETVITKEIEGAIESLSDVRRVASASSAGISSITVEFEAEADLEKSIRDLKDAIDTVNDLPEDAFDPVVTEIRANDIPIVTFSLGSSLDERRLKELADTIQDELDHIPGVSSVTITGARNREFDVRVGSAALARINISLSQIVAALAAANVDIPLGDLTIDGADYHVRATSKFTSIDDIKGVAIATNEGTVIRIGDIARVEDAFEKRTTSSYISIGGAPARPTLSLQVFKKTGGNIIAIVDTAKDTIDELKTSGIIPRDVSVEVSSDYSKFIRDDLETLGGSGVESAVLVFFVMLLALSFREALVALFAVPFTFLITFVILYITGNTLNSLSLFSLVLSLGLFVDAFIVILQGIFINLKHGYKPLDAALLSVSHFKLPLLAGAFTTVAAFVPMLLVSGIVGQYLRVMPITISVTLVASMFVTLVLVPALAAIFIKPSSAERPIKESIMERYVTNRLTRTYRENIMKFLSSRRAKRRFSFIVAILFFGSMAFLVTGYIPVKLFPTIDVDFTFIDVEMPVGTDREETEAVVQQVEDKLYSRQDVKSFVTTIGGVSSFGFDGAGAGGDHLAHVNVNFKPFGERSLKSYEIVEEIRKDLEAIPQGTITIRAIQGGPPTGAPIEVRVSGDDLGVLEELSSRVERSLIETEGTLNVKNNREVSPADITFALNRTALAEAGFSAAEVAGYIRTALFGVTATEVTLADTDIDVVVRLERGDVDTLDALKNLAVPNRSGEFTAITRLADFSLKPALATIRHRDFKRSVSLTADVKEGYTPAQIVPQIEERVRAEAIPDGYEIAFGGEVEDIERSFTELWYAMIVAVILILAILVLQFDSYLKPLVILSALPLSIIGVVVGLLLLRLPFSFSVFLGIISLVGIAVANAIVLLDKVDRNRKEFTMSLRAAIADAGQRRLEPILLTTLTAIVGVVPLARADEFWLGLSVAIGFGLAFATVLQLYVVPMLYLKLEGWFIKRRARRGVV